MKHLGIPLVVQLRVELIAIFGGSVRQHIESRLRGLMNAQLVGKFLICQFVSMPRWILLNAVDQLGLDKLYLSASQQILLLYSTGQPACIQSLCL